MTTWISGRMGQFAYFDHQLGGPNWAGKRVLDFGGNVGNILLDRKCAIRPADYWCFEVSRDAVTEGRRRHPDAHFIFYDRYNYEYNPTGTVGLPIPDPGVRFDVIVAWSVVTHNGKADTLELIGQLVGLLAEGGRLAFTFLDPNWAPPPGWARDSEQPGMSNLHGVLSARRTVNPDIDVTAMLARAERCEQTWTTLVNADELILDPDDTGLTEDQRYSRATGTPYELDPDHRAWRTYLSLCTPTYMNRLFPHAEIRPPVRPERHHCAILDAPKGTGRR